MQPYIFFFVFNGFIYLIFAFTNWEIDPQLWGWGGRYFFSVFIVVGTMISICIYGYLENNNN